LQVDCNIYQVYNMLFCVLLYLVFHSSNIEIFTLSCTPMSNTTSSLSPVCHMFFILTIFFFFLKTLTEHYLLPKSIIRFRLQCTYFIVHVNSKVRNLLFFLLIYLFSIFLLLISISLFMWIVKWGTFYFFSLFIYFLFFSF